MARPNTYGKMVFGYIGVESKTRVMGSIRGRDGKNDSVT
jgi:hypothetical protein